MSEGPDFRQGGQDHSLLPTGANKVLSLLTGLVWKTFLPKGSHTHTHTYTQPTSLYPYTHSQSFMHTSNSPTLPHSDIQQTHTCAYSHTCTTYTHTQTWHPFSYMPMFSHTPICSPIHTHPNTWDTATHTPILSHTHTHTCTHTEGAAIHFCGMMGVRRAELCGHRLPGKTTEKLFLFFQHIRQHSLGSLWSPHPFPATS